ncbi:hypothetical protein GCK72_013713 [Caenorhabditis remanei]|uniref:NADP-dependent oxidoreductase domain-containing protein n=1 Tax=Caenorhabditis remanei TaxID=31234 RepID=A0A6A5GP97_CAERE|nr:hypothetical protein GCK72_013713 [Caenorhabditis remanei]KAF1757258.1 hypothetical protein GCK72_013713 [Caenorhabditis remanei]
MAPKFELRNGQKMPKLALGTYLSHGQDLFNVVDKALSVGYRSFDTAKYYENEKELGDALKELLPRYDLKIEDVFITTKIFPYSGENALELMTKDINQSLENLGRQYLDLVLIHYPRPLDSGDKDSRNAMYRKESWLALEKLHADSKVLSIGVSNYEICHIEEMRDYLTIDPAVNQVEYHPHFQRKELREYCQINNILFQAFSPLGRGNKTLLNDSTMVRIANTHQTSVAVIILAWIMRGKNGVVAKTTSGDRAGENFKSVTLKLTDDEFARINELDLATPYVEDRGWEVL